MIKPKFNLLLCFLACFCINNLYCQNEITIQQKRNGALSYSSYYVVKKSSKKIDRKASTIQLIHIDSFTIKEHPLNDVLSFYLSQSSKDGLDYFCLYNITDSYAINDKKLIAYEMAKSENGGAKPMDIMFKQICGFGDFSMNLTPDDYLVFVDSGSLNKVGSFMTDVKLFLVTSNGIVGSSVFKKRINPNCFFFNTQVINEITRDIPLEFLERKLYLPEKKIRLQ